MSVLNIVYVLDFYLLEAILKLILFASFDLGHRKQGGGPVLPMWWCVIVSMSGLNSWFCFISVIPAGVRVEMLDLIKEDLKPNCSILFGTVLCWCIIHCKAPIGQQHLHMPSLHLHLGLCPSRMYKMSVKCLSKFLIRKTPDVWYTLSSQHNSI